MKKLTTVVLIMIAAIATSFAQKVNKFGYLNSYELLTLMPEKAKADTVIDKYARDLDNLANQMAVEYQTKATNFQQKYDKKLMSEAEAELAAKELQDLEQRINEFQQASQQKVQKKQDDLYSPIMQKVNDAIKAVAKANGYTYIFDSSAGSLLYADESDDVLPLLKSYLKLPEPKPASTAPKTGTTPK